MRTQKGLSTMCDFRKITTVIIDNREIPITEETGRQTSFDPSPPVDAVGLYCVGASGCGLYYWDGKNWFSDYEYNLYDPVNHCEFR